MAIAASSLSTTASTQYCTERKKRKEGGKGIHPILARVPPVRKQREGPSAGVDKVLFQGRRNHLVGNCEHVA